VKALGMPAGSDADAVEIMSSLIDFPLAAQGDPGINGTFSRHNLYVTHVLQFARDSGSMYDIVLCIVRCIWCVL